METEIEFASLFPAGIQATNEDVAREAYPQAFEYLQAHLPAEMLEAALQQLRLMSPELYLASAETAVDGYRQAIAIIFANLPEPLWSLGQAWLARAEGDYPGQASQVVQVFQRDGYLTPPDGGPAVYGDGSIQAPGNASMAAADHEISDEAEFQEALAYLSQNVLPDQLEAGQARIESASSGSYMMEAMAYVASLVGTHTDAAQPTRVLHASVPSYPAPDVGIWSDPQNTMDQGMAEPSGSGDMSWRGTKRRLDPSDASTEPRSQRQRTMTDPSVSAPPPGGSGVSGLADRIRDWGTGIEPDPSLSETLLSGNTAAAREMLRNPKNYDELWSIAQTTPGLLALLIDVQGLPPAELYQAVLASVQTEADWQTTAEIPPQQDASDLPAASSAPLALGDTEWLGDEHIAADFALLAEELRQTDLGFAAQTRLVPPDLVQNLRLAGTEYELLVAFQRIVHDPAGQDTARFLFLPVNNGDGVFGGTHWSLLFVDRDQPGEPQAHHYDSLQGLHQLTIAGQLAGRLGVQNQYWDGQMAQQANGYDCGVSVLAATRELATRLVNGQAPEAGTLQLGDVVADRPALQVRLGGQPAADEDDETDEEPDLAGIAAATPRETKANGKPEAAGAWADRLKQKNPGLTAAQAAAIVGAREGISLKGAVPGAVGRGAREAGRDRGGDAAGDESQRQARGGRGLGGSAEAEEPGPHRRAGRSHRGGPGKQYR